MSELEMLFRTLGKPAAFRAVAHQLDINLTATYTGYGEFKVTLHNVRMADDSRTLFVKELDEKLMRLLVATTYRTGA